MIVHVPLLWGFIAVVSNKHVEGNQVNVITSASQRRIQWKQRRNIRQ